MSVTSISPANKFILWGKAAGRCEYRGCNKSLFQDALTKGEFNQAYIAHIVADVPGGPRGDAVRSALLQDNISNLMLLCDSHHRKIDAKKGANYSEQVLLEMKKEHEDRIERNCDIAPNMQSHILTYKANVGLHTPELSYQSVSQYLLPTHYPALDYCIDLSLSNSVQRDRDAEFWVMEEENLKAQVNKKLLQNFSTSAIKHLSIFAFAPMPLLIKLGTLINNIYSSDVYHKIRVPDTWRFDEDEIELKYLILEPNTILQKVALNISLSATITNDRITSVLGNDTSIYTITIENPNNDFIRNKKHITDFGKEISILLNSIKAKYNAQTPLHIFAAMGVSTSVQLGKVWMPKADMPLYLYDENTANGGFTKVMEILNN